MGQQEGPIEKHHFRDTRVHPQEIKRRLMRSSCYYHVPIARASASSMSKKNILRGFHSDDEQRKCERYRQSMNAIHRCCKSQGSGLSRGAWRCRNLLSFIEFAPFIEFAANWKYPLAHSPGVMKIRTSEDNLIR